MTSVLIVEDDADVADTIQGCIHNTFAKLGRVRQARSRMNAS
jgi:response regulator of citrate/malate metabolism